TGMAYLQDGIEGSQEWAFAKSKELSGDPEAFGQDMRTAFKVWVKFGSPKREEVKVPEIPNDRRYFKNYDSSLKGEELKKQTYVTCKGNFDAYDNIRTSIYHFRNEKRAVGIGVVFSWPLSDTFLSGTGEGGFGHFMFATGWIKDYLEVVNSYGKEAGKKGKHYLSRETINYFVEKYGAYMLIDMPVEKARELREKSVALKKNPFLRFTAWIKYLWRKLVDPGSLGGKRSSGWREFREKYIKKYCPFCGRKGSLLVRLELHHIMPFHLDPSLELDPTNVETFCRYCHFEFAHLKSFQSFNKDILKDVEIYQEKIRNRP
ncbi:MAG: HNH endonuclease signature motif containing protein, partial [Patescibacteria group bacterium]